MNTQALHQNASPLSGVEQNSDDELRDIAALATEVLTDLNQKLWVRFAADAAGEQFSLAASEALRQVRKINDFLDPEPRSYAEATNYYAGPFCTSCGDFNCPGGTGVCQELDDSTTDVYWWELCNRCQHADCPTVYQYENGGPEPMQAELDEFHRALYRQEARDELHRTINIRREWPYSLDTYRYVARDITGLIRTYWVTRPGIPPKRA
ncbi:hypothetical protein ACM0CO_19185 [Mycobacteroides abscessus subsp. abscessus]|uniref:hypothetical protein n=1 Tax=Mycobacteroides abscessus TaxID=36809 RepID=UPI0039EEF54A